MSVLNPTAQRHRGLRAAHHARAQPQPGADGAGGAAHLVAVPVHGGEAAAGQQGVPGEDHRGAHQCRDQRAHQGLHAAGQAARGGGRRQRQQLKEDVMR
eukprot:1182009-Prorocentrum_minimum.AAC.1